MSDTTPGNQNVGWEPDFGAQVAGCITTTTVDLAGLAGAAVNVPQSCIIDWHPQWVPAVTPYVAPVAPQQHAHYHFTPTPLSDADVDRIARRVAEILREAKP